MHEVRLLTAVELGDLLNRCEVGNRVAAAALHRDRRDAQPAASISRGDR